MTRLFYSAILLSAFLAGCSTTQTVDLAQLNALQLGLTQAGVSDLIPTKPVSVEQVRYRGRPWHVAVYQARMHGKEQPYFLAFNSRDKLGFWGTPKHFSKSKDKMIRAVGKSAYAEWLASKSQL